MAEGGGESDSGSGFDPFGGDLTPVEDRKIASSPQSSIVKKDPRDGVFAIFREKNFPRNSHRYSATALVIPVLTSEHLPTTNLPCGQIGNNKGGEGEHVKIPSKDRY